MCSNRNYKSLIRIHGSGNVHLFSVRRAPKKKYIPSFYWMVKNIFVDIFSLGFGGLDNDQKVQITKKIKELNIDTVFLDSSLFGILAKSLRLKFPSIKIFSFFHNVEYVFFRQVIIYDRSYFLFYRIFMAYMSEIYICKYSDKIIALNKRDAELIKSFYRRSPEIIIPISLENTYSVPDKFAANTHKVGLFVGSYFFQNIKAIDWFTKEVLPKVEMKLLIVGSGMDKLTAKYRGQKNIEIYSNVPDLTPYYEQANFVILPIFWGGGMKIKTAEALMYGKFIVGTDEAFMGYDINSYVGKNCNTAEEFINAINKIDINRKYINECRELFRGKYSFSSTLVKFQSIFNSLF